MMQWILVFIASFNSANQKWYPKYGQAAGLENRITLWMELPVPARD